MNIFSKLINIDSYKDIGVSNLNPSFFACYLKKLHDETKQAVVGWHKNLPLISFQTILLRLGARIYGEQACMDWGY